MSATAEFAFRPLQLPDDTALLHRWVTDPKAAFWGMQGLTHYQVEVEYRRLQTIPDCRVLVATRDSEPCFLTELYEPSSSPLAGIYEHAPGDIGMHLLVPSPSAAPEPGFTLRAITAVMFYAFALPGTERIVVEPDIRNKAIQALNARAGFIPARPVELKESDGSVKSAMLSFCTRDDLERASGAAVPGGHLEPNRWRRAHRQLLAKALGEFSHERLLHPVALGGERFYVQKDAHRYEFTARCYRLDHWRVDPTTLAHFVRDGEGWTSASVDVLDFLTHFASDLTLQPEQLPTYLEEVSSTLASHCFKQLHALSSEQLASFTGTVAESFQRIEAAMTEGHPCFVANSGRIGVGRSDYVRFAPEAGSAQRLGWVAAHRSCAHFNAVDGIDYESLLSGELSRGERLRLERLLRDRLAGSPGRPDEYLLIPVHPWQWENRLSTTFANDLARLNLVWLGYSADLYQPQQSIRTFFNVSAPQRHYVKTAMSIVNMGFMRGLSADYMAVTPAINQWLHTLFREDSFLREQPVQLLREVAAIGYRNQQFEAATQNGADQRKMLAALWRESPMNSLEPGQHLATMASLLHVDDTGHSFAAELIRRSGVPVRQWLSGYFDAYLVPLVHCLVAYDLVFMPHGENIILVLRDGAVEKVFLKDLGEEIAVLSDRVELPGEIRRVRTGGDPVLATFTDVFDSFFRFLAPLLQEAGLIDETEFWALVADRLLHYRQRHQHRNPEWARRFDELGLFSESFPLSCLNRLQLRNHRHMLDLADQSGGLLYAGDLENPLARQCSMAPGRDGPYDGRHRRALRSAP